MTAPYPAATGDDGGVIRAAVALVLVATACGGHPAPRATPSPSVSHAPGVAPARYADAKAGLDYAIPDGWYGVYTEDVLDFFTSVTQSVPLTDEDSDEPPTFGMLGAGPFASTFYDPASGGLGKASMNTAVGFAEFFVPVEGTRTVLLDRAERIGGRDAWRVRLRVVPKDPSDGHPATFELVGVATEKPSYVVSFVSGDDRAMLAAVQAAMADVRTTGQ